MKRMIFWVPLALFLVLAVTVGVGLYSPSDSTIRSRMIGKPVPAFSLPPAVAGKPGLSSKALAEGQPRIVNVFASWCIPCIAEAPQLLTIAKAGVPIDAIAIRDREEDIAEFLAQHGDPYRSIGADKDSRVQLSLGSSGVPETFVVDGKGVVRFQHIGDIRPDSVQEIIAAYEAAK